MVDRANPGSMLLNDGDANFGFDHDAFETEHSRRNVSGAAGRAEDRGPGRRLARASPRGPVRARQPAPLGCGPPVQPARRRGNSSLGSQGRSALRAAAFRARSS